MDVEEAQRRQNRPGQTSSVLPPNHPVNILYRVGVMGGSLYGLNELDVFHQVMHSPNVDHQWFKVGLAASIGISGIKAYMELYEGKMRKQTIEYNNYRTATHTVLVLFFLATAAFHIALWNAYGGGKTILINILFGYGVLLQFMLMIPTWIQNAVTFVGLTFFLQEYQ